VTWLTVVLTVVTGLGGGAGLVALLTVRAQRRSINAQADQTLASTVRTLGDAAAELVEPLRRRVDSTERKLVAAEKRCDELDRKLRGARREADELAISLGRLIAAIHDPVAAADPAAALERLRAMTGQQHRNSRSG
jgi:chromosome segregation ATPase